ncbi:hypothetical protein BDW74DRAFT_74375 [Aspergillus multicolor]|uniref:uncharacterized protein n=1 Tax=Aspergillus multicolor TaxID=41759 RepID=UPI003CCE0A64
MSVRLMSFTSGRELIIELLLYFRSARCDLNRSYRIITLNRLALLQRWPRHTLAGRRSESGSTGKFGFISARDPAIPLLITVYLVCIMASASKSARGGFSESIRLLELFLVILLLQLYCSQLQSFSIGLVLNTTPDRLSAYGRGR